METEKASPEKPPEKSLKRFVFLPFKLAFKFLAAALLLVYVLVGVSAATQLYKRDLYRSQDVSYLYAAIDEVAQGGSGDFKESDDLDQVPSVG